MKKFINELIYINRNMGLVTKIILIVIFISIAMNLSHSHIFSLNFLIYIAIILISIILHEMGHGIAAYILGDDTAKNRGRISFNPLRHIDPLGLLFPVLMAITESPLIIGWAKPVPIDYSKIKHGRLGEFIVAISGVLANLLILILVVILIRLKGEMGLSSYRVNFILYNAYSLNLLLIILNLIPIPPLDGSRILAAIGPNSLRDILFYFERYGIIIILILAWTGILDNFLLTTLRYFDHLITYNFLVNYI